MALQKFLLGLAIAAIGLSHPALAQETSPPDDELQYGFNDENVIIVGAVREAGEALKIDTEAEKYLTELPEASDPDTDMDKDAALLAFALNGLEIADTEETQADITPAK